MADRDKIEGLIRHLQQYTAYLQRRCVGGPE
jgi:hypothetical protein